MEDADDLETVDDGQGVAATDEDAGQRKALWSQLRGMIGADISSFLSVPVFIMEPTTTLQKAAEIMQYIKLLDVAADEDDEDMRLALVCALAVSTYSSNERTKKPFNPILGETWECAFPHVDGGATYVAEQVCHHPPISAGHAKSSKWTYDITSAVKTKFMGNWVDVWPVGRTRIRLERTGEVYNICPPPSRVNNVLVGRTWVDTFGAMQVQNLNTGASALIKFKECNMFGMGRWEVGGDILGADGEVKYHLKGHWNDKVSVVKAGAAGGAAGAGGEEKVLWTKDPMPEDGGGKYGFSDFTRLQCAAESCPPGLLASDSRLRPDRAALEAGNNAEAGSAKHALEEMQRGERKLREDKGDAAWAPRWFKLAEHAHLHELEQDVGTAVWEWNGEYEAHSAERAKKAGGVGGSPTDLEFNPWQYEETVKAAAPAGSGGEGAESDAK